MSEVSDDELILSYRATLQSSIITEIFLRYSDKVYRMALRMSGNPADAEDAMQSSFIKCIENLHQYQIGSNFKAWLMRIVINTCKHKYNEEKSRSIRESKFSHKKDNLQMDEIVADNDELKSTIKKCVFQLPEKYSAPIWLVLYEGFSYSEVATTLSLPEKTVRTQVSRGLEKLRMILSSLGIFKSVEIISILISTSKLEIVPISVINTIKSIKPHESLVKNSSTANSESNRLMGIEPKSAFLSNKFLLLSIFVGLGTLFGVYFVYFNLDQTTNFKEVNSAKLKERQTKVKAVYTNQTWSFLEKEDSSVRLLQGQWEWSPKHKAMASPVNMDLAIKLPIQSQEKAFMLEFEIFSEPTAINPKIDVEFGLDWENKDGVVKYKKVIYSNVFKPNAMKPKIKLYFYQNYIFTFTNNHCDAVKIYFEDIKEAYPVIFSKNFYYRTIKSSTLEIWPPELIKAIQMQNNDSK